jgi:plasmid replication initiation protein
LLSKPLEIKTDKGWLLCNWLSSAESDKKEGYVDVCFDPKIKPYLLKLKECFTIYQLKNILFLHSAYSVRTYEMLKQFESTGIKTISVDELRDILRVSPNYTVGNITQRILKPAQKELKEHTDISFTYNFIKHGRRFTDITFKIKRNTRIPKLLQEEKSKDKDIKRVSLQELANKCLKEQNCETIKLIMPYCKLCANCSKKLEQLKHIPISS